MLRIFFFSLLLLTPGCSSLGGAGAVDPAITNLLITLVGQATGVALNKTCTAPPVPSEVLVACQAQPLNATPQQLEAALTACVTNSAVAVALVKYQQRVCTPTAP